MYFQKIYVLVFALLKFDSTFLQNMLPKVLSLCEIDEWGNFEALFQLSKLGAPAEP